MNTKTMQQQKIVSPQDWEAAREQLLVKEKAFTRSRDALAAERRRMPWLAVEKKYEFDAPKGKASLLDLFEGRRQLVLYRAFFEPGVHGWPDHACRGCSFGADQVAHLAHLNARDTTLVYASRAPQADIVRLKQRMGWSMPWYTITDSFDLDFGVDQWHGTNVFIRDGERVFRTYFINNRGDEAMGSTWSYLDATPLGRQEEWEDSRRISPREQKQGYIRPSSRSRACAASYSAKRSDCRTTGASHRKPSHARSSMAASQTALGQRAASISSSRRSNWPPVSRASRSLSSAEKAWPRWRKPLGDGAKRTFICAMADGERTG